MKQPEKKAPSYPAHVMWPQTLEYVGRTLFGRQWRTHVARTLKVPRKTITKWMTEGAPGWICANIEKIGYAKYEKLAQVCLRLSGLLLSGQRDSDYQSKNRDFGRQP